MYFLDESGTSSPKWIWNTTTSVVFQSETMSAIFSDGKIQMVIGI